MVIHIGLFGYLYKNIGLAEGIDDSLLSWAGSFAALTQAITRVIVGSLYDKFGFKPIFYILGLLNMFVGFTCYYARHNEWAYVAVI